jgi:hypothetical protein
LRDDEGEGVGSFTYDAGSIVDTTELRDYTCNLGCRGREYSDELLRHVVAMRLEKSIMTKAREESFLKARAKIMSVVDELVYAQMMMQGRLIEARHQRQSELVKETAEVKNRQCERWDNGDVSITGGHFDRRRF